VTWLEVRFPVNGGTFVFSTASGALPVSYPMVTRDSFVSMAKRPGCEADSCRSLKVRGALPPPGDVFLVPDDV
jgi:hypothetical protein